MDGYLQMDSYKSSGIRGDIIDSLLNRCESKYIIGKIRIPGSDINIYNTLGMKNYEWLYSRSNEDSPRVNIWAGSVNSFTLLHHDLESVILWQCDGLKNVKICSPEATLYLKNQFGVYSNESLVNSHKNITVYEIVLSAGDIMHIPPGWWHQVVNIELSLSITNTSLEPINKKWIQVFGYYE